MAVRGPWICPPKSRSTRPSPPSPKQLADARATNRITRVPFDPALKVDTDWDLGVRDSTAIWFSQSLRTGEVRLIDYYEAGGEGMPHYVQVLQDKARTLGYVYGEHWAPPEHWAHESASSQESRGSSRSQPAHSADAGAGRRRRVRGCRLLSATSLVRVATEDLPELVEALKPPGTRRLRLHSHISRWHYGHPIGRRGAGWRPRCPEELATCLRPTFGRARWP
jgi:hypothetical protein